MSIQTILRQTIISSSLALMTFFVVPSAYAATLNLTPATGYYSDAFTVDLIVEGGTQSFNAAQATVTLSSNLQLSDLVYGNCNFSLLTIPSAANPSFVGVLLGNSSKRCTVYSMTLKPTAAGQGSITLSNASIREYNTGKELLTGVQTGSYSLTGAQSIVTPVPTTVSAGGTISAYNLNVKIVSDTNSSLKESRVVLTPQDTTGGGDALQVITNANGVAQLHDVPPGVYKMAVTENGRVLSERVITVAGDEPEITFGVKQGKTQATNPLLIIGGMILGIALLAIGVWFILSHRQKQM